MLSAARAFVGTTEVTAAARVGLIRQTVAPDTGQPWCMDFVQACVAYAESINNSVSLLPESQDVLDTWKRAISNIKVSPPEIGDIVLWQERGTTEGHCGLIVGMDSLLFTTIEGNTSDAQQIDRNGRGVFVKRRARGGTRTFSELGFIRAF